MKQYLEDNLLMNCVFWFKYQYPEPKYLIHHSPQEGKRNRITNKYGKTYSPEAVRLKKKGTRAGFPDLCVISANHIFFVEMKSEKGKLSENQKEVIAIIDKLGFKTYVVNSLELFMKVCSQEIC